MYLFKKKNRDEEEGYDRSQNMIVNVSAMNVRSLACGMVNMVISRASEVDGD